MSLLNEALTEGLTEAEYHKIVDTLGRDPNRAELGIFSAMWSEHCCYKSSRIHLRKLPTGGPKVVQGPGENAGAMDIGEGMAVVFKIESHNHPSFIEPHQGAATGVGGILRDIFTMGARPIALLDSLRFGEPSNERTPYLVHGVVSGIGGYGNCIGIPTVGGEIYFDASYNGNNLVNAMAVGVVETKQIHLAQAKGEGNVVMYLGSKTGRDGIHGATMASQEFGSGNEERRPTVQVGDPFAEKLLMEASLEMIQANILVGIQDMGAAGIACSTFEMSSRGASGMEISLDKIPLREKGMNAYEIFLSESQERMLLVAEPKNVDRVLEIAKKWDIDCTPIGHVTHKQRVVAKHRGETIVDLAVSPITDGGPLYDRPSTVPATQKATVRVQDLKEIDMKEALLRMVESPNLCSRRHVFEQYDYTVGTDTVVIPGSDAALLRIKGRKGAIAIAVDSNSNYCAADPYIGTGHVVAEAARNLACVGAKPLGVTNCLNFGNPEEPEVMGQFKEAVRGMSEACKVFETPVTGGNVSLYNQTGPINIKPTPTIGMVGWVEDVIVHGKSYFKKEGLTVALLGTSSETELFQSEFARQILQREDLACPPLNLDEEKKLQETLYALIQEGWVESAHDCSDGGLIMNLVESCFHPEKKDVGVQILIPKDVEPISFLFGEYGARATIAFEPNKQKKVEALAKNHGVSFTRLGTTGGKNFDIKGSFQVPLSQLRERHEAFFKGL